MDAFKKHTHGYRHICKSCQYQKEMSNSDLHSKRLARMKKYRDSEQGKLASEIYSKSDAGKLSRKNALRKYENGSGKSLKMARAKLRKLSKMQRTPAWLTDFDKLKMSCIYSVAAMLTRENKEPWHVDHIVPLQGKNVCGLHVQIGRAHV